MHIVSHVSIVSVIAIALTGCVSTEEYRAAVSTVDSNWQVKNDQVLKNLGQRLIQADRFRIFTAARGAFRRIGMVVEKQDYGTGFLFATAPAPVPLTPAEWKIVEDRDTPEMQRLAARDMGPLAYFASLDPVGKEVLANVFITEKPSGVEVSLGLRLRNNANVVKGLSNRTQVPPTALHFGLQKFWAAFESPFQ